MAELPEYVLELLREGVDFTLYRGRERGNPMPILGLPPLNNRRLGVSGGSNTNTR